MKKSVQNQKAKDKNRYCFDEHTKEKKKHMRAQQKILYSAATEAVIRTCDPEVSLEAAPPDHVKNEVVNLYPQVTFQRIDGFGGAMTESCAYLLSQMPADTRKEL